MKNFYVFLYLFSSLPSYMTEKQMQILGQLPSHSSKTQYYLDNADFSQLQSAFKTNDISAITTFIHQHQQKKLPSYGMAFSSLLSAIQ